MLQNKKISYISKIKYVFIIFLYLFFPGNNVFSQENPETDQISENNPVANDTITSIEESTPKLNLSLKETIYDRPYSFWENKPDYKRIKVNTGIVLGGAVMSAGILYVLPESVSNWNREEMSINTIFSDWWDHVREGPVVDGDDFFLNYVTHPYCGAIYYMGARSAGLSAPYSFLYAVGLSTFFWEYGIEAFAEVPSVQDLIVTPVCGAILGEAFYLAKREIVSRDYCLLNSKILGHTVTFLMDPLNEVVDLCSGKFKKKKNSDISLYSYPTMQPTGEITYNIAFNLTF
jgi:hypothetical protein